MAASIGQCSLGLFSTLPVEIRSLVFTEIIKTQGSLKGIYRASKEIYDFSKTFFYGKYPCSIPLPLNTLLHIPLEGAAQRKLADRVEKLEGYLGKCFQSISTQLINHKKIESEWLIDHCRKIGLMSEDSAEKFGEEYEKVLIALLEMGIDPNCSSQKGSALSNLFIVKATTAHVSAFILKACQHLVRHGAVPDDAVLLAARKNHSKAYSFLSKNEGDASCSRFSLCVIS